MDMEEAMKILYDIITYARVLHEEKKDKLLEKSKEWCDMDTKITDATTWMLFEKKAWRKE